MDSRTASQVAAMVAGEIVGDGRIQVGPGVEIDSRKVEPGSLFVALPGERSDGHDWVAAAARSGATAALVALPQQSTISQIVVADPLAALAELARGIVTEAVAAGLQTVAITGSSGKTGTKDLLAAILARRAPTVAPVGSFNNEIGVPLTACRVSSQTRYLVSEMGARGPGHIAHLCGIVAPQVSVVLNVGHAHLGEFGSVSAIANAKAELVEAVSADGWAVLNSDDPVVAAMRERTGALIAAWSTRSAPDFGDLRVWAEGILPDAWQRFSFRLRSGAGVDEPVSLRVVGEHQVANALAAATAALALGLEAELVAEALSAAEATSRWRMELRHRPDGLLVVNDAYNANPDSMAAALRAAVGLRRPNGRVIAVLGDMLELGPEGARRHREVGELAGDLGVDVVIAVGGFGPEVVAGAAASGLAAAAVPDAATALTRVSRLVGATDVVIVKASRGIALETVAEGLADQGVQEDDPR